MIKSKKQPTAILRYVRGHKRALLEGFSMPWKHPVKSLMTILTLAICFYIPLLLWTLWLNYDELKQSWQNQGSIAIFLSGQISEAEAEVTLQNISDHPIVEKAQLQNPESIKSQLSKDQQLSQVVQFITAQDLPQQISVQVKTGITTQEISQFIKQMNDQSQIEYISYDEQWLTQLQALTSTLLQMANVSAVIFILIVIVILANIITNEISEHKSELRLLELIGASWSQVRRSFLYMGTLLGVYAALLSIVFISLSFWWLRDTINALVENFGVDIKLHGLNYLQVMMVITVALMVTWLGTRLSLSQQLLNQTKD